MFIELHSQTAKSNLFHAIWVSNWSAWGVNRPTNNCYTTSICLEYKNTFLIPLKSNIKLIQQLSFTGCENFFEALKPKGELFNVET